MTAVLLLTHMSARFIWNGLKRKLCLFHAHREKGQTCLTTVACKTHPFYHTHSYTSSTTLSLFHISTLPSCLLTHHITLNFTSLTPSSPPLRSLITSLPIHLLEHLFRHSQRHFSITLTPTSLLSRSLTHLFCPAHSHIFLYSCITAH